MSEAAYFSLIPVEDLAPNSYNARRFEENMTAQRKERFEELVASVTEKGIIEPLLVRPVGDRFEVIAGERRYRAALRAANRFGESTGYVVPCMVRDVNDDEAFDLMVIENLQREDLSPMETAQAFQAYLQRYGNTADAVAEIAARTGIPSHAIRRQVRLLELPPEILAAWREGTLSQSHVEKFTGISDRAQMLELLTACQRSKLSVRELAERIGAVSPELERGFFDKTECQVCSFNSAVQSGLFPDGTPGGRCGSAGCFESKQEAFLTAKWPEGKAAQKFGTRGFRFGHRLGNEQREQILAPETAERCLSCDVFVSVLRLTGIVVSGYERVCIGPRKCYEELYLAPKVLPTAAPTKPEAAQPVAVPVDEKGPEAGQIRPLETKDGKAGTKAAKTGTKSPEKKPSAPPEETGPVYNSARGDRYRQLFVKEGLQEKMKITAAIGDQRVLALALLALASVSLPARRTVDSLLGLGNNSDTRVVAEKIGSPNLSVD